MINIQNLVGGYTQSPIIKGLDLEIKKGEFFALLGQNGSGKTTLFKLITGQFPIKRGKITLIWKRNIDSFKIEKAKKMAVLTQEVQRYPSIIPWKKSLVLDVIPIKRGFLKQLSKKDRKVIEEVMEITKISDFRKTPVPYD